MTPFRPNSQAARGSNLLRMGITIAHSKLFCGHERREGKNILLDLTAVVILCTPTNLKKEGKRPVCWGKPRSIAVGT